MISIPIWVFVLLIVLASITALLLLLILIGIILSVFTPTYHEDFNGCPDEIENDG